MSETLKCKVCGKLASEDCNFNNKQLLCNKHSLQLKRYGKFLDNIPSFKKELHRICWICGDTQHKRYGFCNIAGEYYGKEMCGKHLNQMRHKGMITDSAPSQHRSIMSWTEEDIETLTDGYASGLSTDEIANKLNRTPSAICCKAKELGLTDIYVSKYSVKYDAPYKHYHWLKERYLDKLMSPVEIAAECNATPRVISKWCEKYHLSQTLTKRCTPINDRQRELIMFSLLGDGHITKRKTRPMFIVSHAVNQKEYLFWKYDILKNLCNREPKYYNKQVKEFNNKEYISQEFYRFETRILNALFEIRDMRKSDIISQLNEFGLAIHFLDDAYRSAYSWTLCYAALSDEDKAMYRNILTDRFDLQPRLRKDTRYIGFSKEDSLKIDKIILRNIPNDLDIIKYKIIRGGDDE